MSVALVIGAGGQDGRLLTEKLTREGARVVGVTRGGGVDVLDDSATRQLIATEKPDEVYYLAAYHHSSQDRAPEPAALLRDSFAVHVDGLINVLEAIRTEAPRSRLFYAASSHVFGPNPPTPLQDESTPLDPANPYAVTKVAGVHCCRFYRAAHDVFASVGYLYNHESPYRRPEFVTTKIIRAAVAISRGSREKLVLGDLSAKIDWGWAADYVEAMTRILRTARADDFVIATGEAHSVQEFAQLAFAGVGLDWREHVEEKPGIITRRSLGLVGNPEKLTATTGWAPTVTFEGMIRKLLDSAAAAT